MKELNFERESTRAASHLVIIICLTQNSPLLHLWTLGLNPSCASEVPRTLPPPPLTTNTATLTVTVPCLLLIIKNAMQDANARRDNDRVRE